MAKKIRNAYALEHLSEEDRQKLIEALIAEWKASQSERRA
jgi:hypothetical protein